MRRSAPLLPATIILAAAVFAVLATPAGAGAAPILYSVTGSTVWSESGAVADVTGDMLISSEAWGDLEPPFGTNSLVFYDIEQFHITLEGLGAVSGTGSLTIEYEGPIWGQFSGEPDLFSVRFFHADGAAYPFPAVGADFPLYFAAPPMMTFRGVYFSPYQVVSDLTLTQVPEPASTLLLLGPGLVGLGFLRRRRR